MREKTRCVACSNASVASHVTHIKTPTPSQFSKSFVAYPAIVWLRGSGGQRVPEATLPDAVKAKLRLCLATGRRGRVGALLSVLRVS